MAPQFCGANSLDARVLRRHANALLRVDPRSVPFFDQRYVDTFYHHLYVPTPSTSAEESEIVAQADSSWFAAHEFVNNAVAPLPRVIFPPVPDDVTNEGEDQRLPPPKEKTSNSTNKRAPMGQKSRQMKQNGQMRRVRKIRIVPDPSQSAYLRQVIGIGRAIYNECVEEDHARRDDESKKVASKKELRRFALKQPLDSEKEWKNVAHSYSKNSAIDRYVTARSAAFSNLDARNINHFEMRPRSRFKSRQEEVAFEHYRFDDQRDYSRTRKGSGEAFISINTGLDNKTRERFYLSDIGKVMHLRIKGPVPREFRGRQDAKTKREDIRIVRTRQGEYFAVVQFVVQQEPRFNTQIGTTCSFDPGARTFLTWYSEDGTFGDICSDRTDSWGQIKSMLASADHIQSLLARDDRAGKRAKKRRRRRKRARRRLFQRVRERIKDLHRKVASWCTRRFRLILLPKFETSQMVENPLDGRGRLINSEAAKKLLTWSHYSFQQRIIDMSQRYTDVIVLLANEAYTTQQCGCCGAINDIGGSSIFVCNDCGLRAPRDMYSSTRILQRALPRIIMA